MFCCQPPLILVPLVFISALALSQAVVPMASTFSDDAGYWHFSSDSEQAVPAAFGLLAAAASTQTPASDAKTSEPEADAKQSPPAANDAREPLAPPPVERLPAGSPVSFPVDI